VRSLADQQVFQAAQWPTGPLDSSEAPSRYDVERYLLSPWAHVIHASGSTGRPIAAVVPRSALVNFVLSMPEALGLGSADPLLAVTTTSFDIPILELLLRPMTGAQLDLATKQDRLFRVARLVLKVHGMSFACPQNSVTTLCSFGLEVFFDIMPADFGNCLG
jgi:non-ribosomal peptide synthetase component F